VKFTPFAAVTSTNFPGNAAGRALGDELCGTEAAEAKIIIATKTIQDLFTSAPSLL
jgi:hypothetical protein